MKAYGRATLTPSSIDRLDQIRMSPDKRRIARASMRQAELIADVLVRANDGLRYVLGSIGRGISAVARRSKSVSWNTEMARPMTIFQDERSACLIEAGAVDLQDGTHWKPWLKLTRRAGAVSTSDTFDCLKPVFGSEQAALRYATELGRSLVDEASSFDMGMRNRNAASWWPQHQAVVRT